MTVDLFNPFGFSTQVYNLVLALLLVGGAALGFVVRGERFDRAGRAVNAWATSAVRSIVLCGLVGFALTAVAALYVRMPEPALHDDFGSLLTADTFAHG